MAGIHPKGNQDRSPINKVGDDGEDGFPIKNVGNDGEDAFTMTNVGNDGDDGILLPAFVLARRSATARKRVDKFHGNDDMKIMRGFICKYILMLWCVVGLCPTAVAEEFVEGATPSDAERSLSSLVRGYVQGSSEQSTDKLVPQILNHPGANVKTIEAAIRAIPHYGKAPVGAQPRRSIVVRGRKAEYALYVPSSYDPTQSYPLILCLHGAGLRVNPIWNDGCRA